MLTRRSLLTYFAAVPVIAIAPVALRANTRAPVYANAGIAIDGMDTVAYFAGEGPVRGSKDHNVDWNGATWLFASSENADKFRANPDAYAPQYGGYCAWAVSQGYTAATDPSAWSLYDGKLYLNYNRRIRRRWSADIPGNVARGDANWPSVLSS